jgi:hypothetical protein
VSWIQNSKPPVVPMPGIAGGGTGYTIASWMACASRNSVTSTVRRFSSFAMAMLLYRSSKGRSVMKNVPAFVL